MSDVHSNPAALEKALKDARRHKCGRFVMLGDTTGYGYDVKAALTLVRRNFDVVLLGNHDSACIGREDPDEVACCRNYDIDVAQGKTLSKRDAAWLGHRPYLHFENGVGFVHGTFIRPEGWGYVVDRADARDNFRARGERLMFCGHTHAAAAWERKDRFVEERVLFGRPAVKAESKGFKLRKGCRYVVNVGSVGHPRNDLCSTYVIWDSNAERVTFRRLPFDFPDYVCQMQSRRIALPGWLQELSQDAV